MREQQEPRVVSEVDGVEGGEEPTSELESPMRLVFAFSIPLVIVVLAEFFKWKELLAS